jgi:hypothetical protein
MAKRFKRQHRNIITERRSTFGPLGPNLLSDFEAVTLGPNSRGSAIAERRFRMPSDGAPEIVAKTVDEVSSRFNKFQHPIFVSC